MSVHNRPLKKVAVLVSVGRHPVSGMARYSRNDAAALSMAVTLAQSTADISVDIMHAGDPDNPALSDYLALGAKTIKVVACHGDEDVIPALKQALENYDLILCGGRAEAGEETGLVPYLLASQLCLPLVADVMEITSDSGVGINDVVLQQFLPKGRRRTIVVSLPTLLTVHPLAPSNVRYAYANLRNGAIERQQPPPQTQVAEMSASGHPPQGWTQAPASARPLKLVAQEKRSGHARMLSATVTESRGGKIIQEGSTSEKAQAILAYLREHRLVDY